MGRMLFEELENKKEGLKMFRGEKRTPRGDVGHSLITKTETQFHHAISPFNKKLQDSYEIT